MVVHAIGGNMNTEGYCYTCDSLRADLEDYSEEIRTLCMENNNLTNELDDVREDLHRVAVRENETMHALAEALNNPNLLRLVVQGIVLEYRNGE
jgi:regulator of replication initiation timing